MHRTKSKISLIALTLATTVLACGPNVAEARRPYHQPGPEAPIWTSDVHVSVETSEGMALDSYWHFGSLYVAGRVGERYNIRVENRSPQRVEAVVTVDGRDVVSGEVGDYRKQRGYVIDGYGSVVIEGYRRSFDHVAAFRFSQAHESYSSRRGTPQHVGVIGVAVFKERMRTARKAKPLQPGPYDDGWYPSGEAEGRSAPSGRSDSHASTRHKAGTSAGAPMDAPASSAPSAAAERSRDAGDAALGGARGGFAPPVQRQELGTAYGETKYSSVHEVEFKRRNRIRPDALVTIYYDSPEGLRARGVVTEPRFYPPPPAEPQAFPQARFAPPPPTYSGGW